MLRLSLKPVAERLAELLGKPVAFADDCIGDVAKKAVANLAAGEVLLLENLRFHKAETDNDPEFAKQLAELAELYVNDAFGTAHRAHASTEGITHYMDTCACGYLLKRNSTSSVVHLQNLSAHLPLSSAVQKFPVKST